MGKDICWYFCLNERKKLEVCGPQSRHLTIIWCPHVTACIVVKCFYFSLKWLLFNCPNCSKNLACILEPENWILAVWLQLSTWLLHLPSNMFVGHFIHNMITEQWRKPMLKYLFMNICLVYIECVQINLRIFNMGFHEF